MRFRILATLLGLCAAAVAQTQPCLAVAGERIRARDFTVALPGFAALPVDTPLGYAPLPGARRIFRSSEIAGLAKRYSVDTTGPSELCFEWQMEPLNKEEALAAMRRDLRIEGAKIEIVELSRFAVPHGSIEFPREKLGVPALGTSKLPVVWRGHVVYGGNRRFAIWARVNVTARVPVVVASEDIRAGQLITPGQLRVETKESFPMPAQSATSAEQVSGRVPRRAYSAGSPILLDTLQAPPDVGRGSLVEVEVLSGSAKLGLTGKAESSGHTGELISVRNLASNKIFQARVAGKNKAIVQAGGMRGN